MEVYHEEWESGRVLVWDLAGMASLGVSIDNMEHWCRLHADTDESFHSLE